MNILITGAAGFVGTNLSVHLLRKGYKVTGVDSLSRVGSEQNLKYMVEQFPAFNFIQSEIDDLPGVIYRIKPDLIYHFAAQVAVTSSMHNPRRDFVVNAAGTFEAALAAHNIGARVIYTSTNKVYGDNVNNIPIVELEKRYDLGGDFRGKGIPESFPVDAKHHTPYGCSKLVGDIYVREFGGVVNRCSCMYGPNQNGIVDQGWLSHFARNKILGKPNIIYGDGKQVRDIVHSRDVVKLLELQGRRLMEDTKSIEGEVFNVGGGYNNTISLLELCEMWDIKPTFGDWRPADQKVFYCDISKAKRVLGWEPEVNASEGLKDLFAWTEKNISA